MIRPPATATDRARGRAGSMVSTAPLTSSRSAIGAGWLPTGGRIPGALFQTPVRRSNTGPASSPSRCLATRSESVLGRSAAGCQNLGTLNEASRSAQ